MTVRAYIQQFLIAHGIADGDHVCVGFSGGMDSTALLVALSQTGVRITAVHFQHGIRGEEAEEDATWCRGFCRSLSVDFHCVYLHVQENLRHGEAIEEGARRLRMESWERIAAGDVPVFLAHHGDDAIEELFLRLARGANVSGLTGLREERIIHGVRYLRPLLMFPKKSLEEFLKVNGFTEWRTDSTNLVSEYRRNAVRNRLLPVFRDIFQTDAGLRRSLAALTSDASCLEEMSADRLGELSTIQDWQSLPGALLPRVFRRWRFQQDGVDEPPEYGFLMELRRKLQSFSGKQESIQMSEKLVLRLENGGLRLVDTSGACTRLELSWHWRTQRLLSIQGKGTFRAALNGESWPGPQAGMAVETFRLSDMPEMLEIRCWRPGDRMTPFGMCHSRKLQDVFTDAHVPREERAGRLLVCADDQIIWIPGVKRGEFGRVNGMAPSVVLTFQPEI